MITIAICLIYYGIAVWLYQVHLWISGGQWVSIPVMSAWRAVFSVPATDYSMLGRLSRWFLDWPLSLTLLALGVGILATVLGLRQANQKRRHLLRRQWIAEQCEQAGYTPWDVPKVLADFDASQTPHHGRRKQRFN